MAAEDDRGRYLLGHADDELVRLERQALLFAEATEDGLRRAGLKPGMRVLDLGCGVGDVTVAAARIVGPEGSVLGIDTSAQAVATANRRIDALGVATARCREENIFAVETAGYDAIVGRFLLMHLPDPAALLDRLKRTADPGTIVAFLEMDIGSSAIVPPMALFQTAVSAICDVYRSGGAEPDMGSKLYSAFRKAKLAPRLQGSCRVVGGDDGDVFDYLAGSVASLAPAMKAAGVAPADLDPATLRGRLAEEVARADHCISFPRFVCAWAST